jgi:hypothetical protein
MIMVEERRATLPARSLARFWRTRHDSDVRPLPFRALLPSFPAPPLTLLGIRQSTERPTFRAQRGGAAVL